MTKGWTKIDKNVLLLYDGGKYIRQGMERTVVWARKYLYLPLAIYMITDDDDDYDSGGIPIVSVGVIGYGLSPYYANNVTVVISELNLVNAELYSDGGHVIIIRTVHVGMHDNGRSYLSHQ